MNTELLRKPFSRRVFTRVLGALIAGASLLRVPVGAQAQAASETQAASQAQAQPASRSEPINRIAFGSCVHQDKPQPVWDVVNAAKPDVFVFLGDNIYGDSEDPAVLQAKYKQLGAVPGFQQLRQQTDVVAIWDDHDYGVNDGGLEYPSKEASRQVMLDFFGEPADSERRSRPDGI